MNRTELDSDYDYSIMFVTLECLHCQYRDYQDGCIFDPGFDLISRCECKKIKRLNDSIIY